MYKVGDSVKIITYAGDQEGHPIGSSGKVIKLDGALIMVVIDNDDEGFDWACLAHELEPAQ